jgi:hypothetical protein
MALLGSGLTLATERPILHALSSIIRRSSYISTPLFERNRNTANGHCSGFIDKDEEDDDEDEDDTGGGGGELSLPPFIESLLLLLLLFERLSDEFEEELVFTSV